MHCTNVTQGGSRAGAPRIIQRQFQNIGLKCIKLWLHVRFAGYGFTETY